MIAIRRQTRFDISFTFCDEIRPESWTERQQR